MRLLPFFLLAACRTVAPVPESPRADEPPVDAACLSLARAGTLVSSMPAAVGPFSVARRNENTVTLHREGRPLSNEEGTRLWSLLGETRALKSLSSGSSALYSTTKCPGIADASCLTFSVWLCQSSLDEIVEHLRLVTAEVGSPDGELFVSLTIHEAAGPACKDGARCVPTPHYSVPDGRYRSTRGRTALEAWGRGHCRDDGDCEGGGNSCQAWYQRGGAELAILNQMSQPTFCGCVEHKCSWFTQDETSD
ncbi:MAG: hypothetical protein Q8S33_03630 [Myxococcales bacterium]|nr:hypothetical protein [Myxococcales bacterium]